MTTDPGGPPGSNRQPYAPDRFVGREDQIREAIEWVDNRASLLLIIYGPPAIGKSWLISHIDYILRPNPQPPPPHPIFLITLRDMVDDAQPRVGQCKLTDDNIAAWLKRFLNDNRAAGLPLPTYDPVMVVDRNVEAVAEALERHFDDQFKYLLIDEGDLLSKPAWRTLERRVIEPIHAVSKQFRFVVALRNQEQIGLHTSGFKPQPLHVRAWAGFNGEEQLNRLLAADDKPNSVRTNLIKKVQGYDWRHPGLNYFLYKRLVNKPVRNRATLLREGLEHVRGATLALSKEQEAALLGWLEQLAAIDEPLSEETLIILWPEETNLEVNRRRDLLMDHWLLVTGENESQWRLADGLRSFIRACGPDTAPAP